MSSRRAFKLCGLFIRYLSERPLLVVPYRATWPLHHQRRTYIKESDRSHSRRPKTDLVRPDTFTEGPGLKDFISESGAIADTAERECEDIIPPYLVDDMNDHGKLVFFETYGCQMNVNDAEYAWAILQKKGYEKTDDLTKVDVILLVTCSVREKAEERIWSRLRRLKELKKLSVRPGYPKVGLLGCMAERLREKILERDKSVDVIAGPDAYRDLPRLLHESSENSTTAINVMLSVDETYADIMPVRFSNESKTAFVSIMRGCDNMCSFCIVPFTRGRERSRPISSILEEVKRLSDQGIKQVTLLGQNVNSYMDTSEIQYAAYRQPTTLSKGFRTIYKPKFGGLRFADLLDQVSLIDPEMRVRFTSPHPKDFPDEVLHVINDRSNICKQLHMPAQSGSSQVLQRMRRGYGREDYLELTRRIRSLIPDVTLSTDIIAGFCGETEADHEETLSLMREVKYDNAFMFAYSMRKKTHAYHRMQDDVPLDVKKRRLQEIINCYREELEETLRKNIGKAQLVLIEGVSKKSRNHLSGKNDGNISVTIPLEALTHHDLSTEKSEPRVGSYIATKIVASTGRSLIGKPICHVKLNDFYNVHWGET